MKRKHITLVLLVAVAAVAAVAAGIGIGSSAHEPTDPDDVYIHEVDQVIEGPNAQICFTDLGPDVNKVVIQGKSTHINTTFYHDGPEGDMYINVPRLDYTANHHVILFSNGENPTINDLATEDGFCTQPGTDVTGTVVIGEYNINIGFINLGQGDADAVDLRTGPNVADNAPQPGDGNPTVEPASTSSTPGASTSQTDDDDSDDESVLNETQLDQN